MNHESQLSRLYCWKILNGNEFFKRSSTSITDHEIPSHHLNQLQLVFLTEIPTHHLNRYLEGISHRGLWMKLVTLFGKRGSILGGKQQLDRAILSDRSSNIWALDRVVWGLKQCNPRLSRSLIESVARSSHVFEISRQYNLGMELKKVARSSLKARSSYRLYWA